MQRLFCVCNDLWSSFTLVVVHLLSEELLMLLQYGIQHIIIGMWVKLFCKAEYYLTIKKKQTVCLFVALDNSGVSANAAGANVLNRVRLKMCVLLFNLVYPCKAVTMFAPQSVTKTTQPTSRNASIPNAEFLEKQASYVFS